MTLNLSLSPLPNLQCTYVHVYYSCPQYNIERLKLMCEESLCNNLTEETAADTLVLADLHCAEKLKSITIDYINT